MQPPEVLWCLQWCSVSPAAEQQLLYLVGLMVHGLRPGPYLVYRTGNSRVSNIWFNVCCQYYVLINGSLRG